MAYHPPFVTETNEPSWTDCTVCSVLMLILAMTLGDVPPTRAEREALRDVVTSSDDGGVTLEQMLAAVQHRYAFDFDMPRVADWAAVRLLAASGMGLVMQGLYAKLGEPFVRWDRGFASRGVDSGHAMYAAEYDPMRNAWWVMDPLGRDGYAGEWVPDANVHAFCDGLRRSDGTYFLGVGRIGSRADTKGDLMIACSGVGLTSAKRARVTNGAADLLDSPGGKRVAGTAIGRTYPYIGTLPGHRAILVDTPLPYPDKISRPTVLYIVTAAVVIEDAPHVIAPTTVSARDAANAALDKVANFALSQKG